jgi:lysine biosynthesis protein LysW
MVTVYCSDCEQPIRLETRPVEGEILFCSCCGAELQVVSVEPVQLAWVRREAARKEASHLWRSDSEDLFRLSR